MDKVFQLINATEDGLNTVTSPYIMGPILYICESLKWGTCKYT